MVPFSFSGRNFIPTVDGALFWPDQQALLVADLHLEKASFFARLGQMLPPYDSIATLTTLTALVERVAAREIWCLGDSFHDRHGCERLSAPARAMLRALTERTRWTWITGNHDPIVGDTCGGTLADEAEVDGIALRHAARSDDPRPEISGHWHPRLRIRVRGRQISRRCFLATPTRLILPAFGSLTGGMDAADPTLLRAVGAPLEALVPTGERLLRFPLAA